MVANTLQVWEKMNETKYDLVQHLPYLTDLAPSDFHLFLQLKIPFGGKRFLMESEVKIAVKNYFRELEKSLFRKSIMVLEHH